MYIAFCVPSILAVPTNAGAHLWNLRLRDMSTLLYVSVLPQSKTPVKLNSDLKMPVYKHCLDNIRDCYCICQALVTSTVFENICANSKLQFYGSRHIFRYLEQSDFLYNHHFL